MTRASRALVATIAALLCTTVAPPAGAAAATMTDAENGTNLPEAQPTAPQRPYSITEERTPCADYAPTRRPRFGDLHVHTARSQDASTQDTRISPADAYRFAQGDPLGIQPYAEDGRPMRRVQLTRPLDFAAVTDHSEQLGEVHICRTPEYEGHGSLACRFYRRFPRVAFFAFNGRYSMFGSRWGFCGDDAENCLGAARIVWQEHQTAAEEAYDRSAACRFTSFVAYEWTSSPKRGHLHRNVIFRNERVPELPISVMETGPIAMNLWRGLDEGCRDGAPGCEAITIPHNSNWSLGTAFTSGEVLDGEISETEAPVRARYDRIVEMMQHKGESECALYPGVADEGCAFEKAPNHFGPADRTLVEIDFARGALKQGLVLDATLGTNPLAFGQIGSTDTHIGAPGLVSERGHPGHGGAGKPGNTVFDGPGLPDLAALNPGGLAVVWSEENGRDSIFAGMKRRETYATSGTRPELRFFGGWHFGDGTCDEGDVAAAGYAGGVPMGAWLPPRPAGAGAPRFVLAATRDPHPEGGDLERLEIVKGWVADGATRERVLTVAGGDREADVDPATCDRSGRGYVSLCRAWTDPEFDPAQPAFYYVRLRETPSCRWTRWACVDSGIVCDGGTASREGYDYCCRDEVESVIQERAWSSPIWYRPPGGA